MADEDTTSADSKAQDDEVGELASDEATGTTLGSAQPKESDKTEASEEDKETSQTSDEAKAGPEESKQDEADNSDEEAEIKEWAAKKNLPLDDPIKVAKMYRESEKELGKKGQEEGQLKQAVGEANSSAGVEDIQALRNEVAALNFYISNPDAKSYEQQMVDILDERPWLAGDLDAVLLMAKGSSSTEAEKLTAERQAGKKEALETVAASERAAPPRASATTRETPRQVTDADIANMSSEEYESYRKEHDPWTAPAQ